MKAHNNFLIYLLLATQLFMQGCQREEIFLIKDIVGQWQIDQITFRKELGGGFGLDSTVKYRNATIHFSKNGKNGEGWYSFDRQEEVPFFFYAHPEPENNLFINVGTKTGPGLHPSISLNGEAPLIERSNNRLVIDFEAGFRNSEGKTVAQTHRAKAILVR